MKKWTTCIVGGWLCLNFSLAARSQTPIKPLQPGDDASHISLPSLLNAPPEIGSTANFKGQLLILDFWATWCTSCIRQFPNAQKLEQQFQGRLQVLGVAYEPTEKIRKWFASPAGRNFHFPTLTGDTLLSKLFPHRTVPHYVWISPNGRVLAITGEESLTAANVRQALAGQDLGELQVKKDLDANRPLFLSEAYPQGNPLLSYSLLSEGRYDGLPAGTRFRRQADVVHGRALTNATLLALYRSAAYFLFEQRGQRFSTKRQVLDLQRPESLTALIGKPYNYELVVPVRRADSLYQDMLQDLNRVTGYHGTIQKRLTACFELKREPGQPVPETKGGKARNTLFELGTAVLLNCPVSYLVNRLDELPFLEAPVLDETGINAKVDLNFKGKPTTLQELNEQLKAQGLRLEKAEHLLDMLVLSDTATGP